MKVVENFALFNIVIDKQNVTAKFLEIFKKKPPKIFNVKNNTSKT